MTTLKHALWALSNLAKLSPAEIASLTVGDVHLTEAEPHLKIWDDQTGERETVAISAAVKNALVGWLIARPDQPSPLLFPGDGGAELSAEDIAALLEDYTLPPVISDEAPPVISADVRAEEQLPPVPSIPVPPPFTPAPPPSMPERVQPPAVEKTPATPPPVAGTKTVVFTPQWGKLIIGGLIGLLVLGVIAAGAFMLFGKRTEPSPVVVITPVPTSTPIPTGTPLPSPTPIPTNTPMPSPTPVPTNTPVPTDTPTAIPSPTAAVSPTSTPVPSPTSVPTATPVAAVVPPPPSPTPTIGFKYPAPKLIAPADGYRFIQGNNIHLQWEPVGELAGNEQYAVRLIYKHNTEIVYRGIGTKETTWTIPQELYRDADGPEFDHKWYVYVEAVQPDGTGKAVSPDSEYRHFTWE